MKRIIACCCIVIMAVMAVNGTALAGNSMEQNKGNEDKAREDRIVSVVFSHDMHSHIDPCKREINGEICMVGGFAKIKTVVDQIKSGYPDTLLLDAGDFSMGTPYQTIFKEEAAELQLMHALGYDATTFGNHEFDYGAAGTAEMINSAGDNSVKLLSANIDWDSSMEDPDMREDAGKLKETLEKSGGSSYTMFERGGMKIAVFGVIGNGAAEYAPASGIVFSDYIDAASETVNQIKEKENPDMIICLSHSGTLEEEKDVLKGTEDYNLAKAVPDIDLIISGHSHTTMAAPEQVGDTFIVSCGEYTNNIGHIVLKKQKRMELKEYEIISLDDKIADDPEFKEKILPFKELTNKEYFAQYGYSVDDVLVNNSIIFTDMKNFGSSQGEEAMGNLIVDSYKYAVAKAENGTIKGYVQGGVASGEVESSEGGAQVVILPVGNVRGNILKGEVTVEDVFDILPLGRGADGSIGYPLVRAYLTGRELKYVADIDASISNYMSVARLYCGGLMYSWNPNRLILNRTVDFRYDDGIEVKDLEEDRLYSVVCDLYSCQMLSKVKKMSLGLLDIEPKDAQGNPITNINKYILHDGNKEIKMWSAMASYLESFEDGEIPQYYSEAQGRKTEIDSLSPKEMLKQPNKVLLIAVAAVLAIIGTIILIIIIAISKVRQPLLK